MAGSAKMRPTGADVEQFLAEIPDPDRRADARALCRLMSEVTGEEPTMWGSGIIGFGTYRYRYESGHEGTSALASFAPRKSNLAIYLIGGFEERHHRLLEQLGPHKAGVGCLYVKRLDDIDLDVLRSLLERSLQVRRGMDRAAAVSGKSRRRHARGDRPKGRPRRSTS